MITPSFRTLLAGLLLALPALARVPGILKRDTSIIEKNNPTLNQFDKRALTYDQAVTKGCQKLNWLQGDQVIAQSVFTDATALPDNGWTEEEANEEFPSDLATAFGALGYSTANADNVELEAIQDQGGETSQAYGSTVAGVAYDSTGGTYTNTFNKVNGVIIATFNYSPQYQDPDARYPPLSAYSDVTWLLWQGYAGAQVAALNYFFRYHIEEENSVPVIDQVLQLSGLTLATLGDWPGVSYGMDTDQGKALLGTPNGAGTAFFLGQHQAQLGRKTIVSANLFKTVLNGKSYRNIAFKIGPVAASTRK